MAERKPTFEKSFSFSQLPPYSEHTQSESNMAGTNDSTKYVNTVSLHSAAEGSQEPLNFTVDMEAGQPSARNGRQEPNDSIAENTEGKCSIMYFRDMKKENHK